jgi:hypothetical protein
MGRQLMAARVKVQPGLDAPAAIRGRLDELAAPAPEAEALPAVGKVVEALAMQIRGEGYGVSLAAHPDDWAGVAGYLTNVGRAAPGEPPRVPVASLLAVVTPNALREWLEGEVAAAYSSLPASVDAKTRAARVAELEHEIAAVEREAADAWWQAIDAGLSLPPPEIVTAAAVLGLEP